MKGPTKIYLVLTGLLVISISLNIAGVYIAYNHYYGTKEERCVLRNSVTKNILSTSDANKIHNMESVTMEKCETEIKNAREFVSKKMDVLGLQRKLNRLNDQNCDEVNENDTFLEADKTNIEDLILLTSYVDKIIGGDKECLPLKCEILPITKSNQSSVLCTFDYKLQKV